MEFSRKLLARNTALNLMGQVLLATIAVVCLPVTIRGLGPERYGILTLVFAVLSYSLYFDLGIGRANVKMVAELLGRRCYEGLARHVWTCCTLQGLIGLLVGSIIAGSANWMVSRVLTISKTLQSEAAWSLRILGLIIVIDLLCAILRGVLEGAQRFDLTNLVRLPAACATYGIPALGAMLGYRLPVIALLLVLAKALFAGVYFYFALQVVPGLRSGYGFQRKGLGPLMQYGGWAMAANITAAVIVLVDRLIIGHLLGMNPAGQYAIAMQAAPLMQIFAMATQTVLFPAASALGEQRRGVTEQRANEGLKLIVIGGTGGVFAIAFLGPIILPVWLGKVIGLTSIMSSMTIVAIGALVNSIGSIPAAVLYGLGRADVIAKLYLVELCGYIVVAWYLTKHFGILGTAFAWVVRSIFETVSLWIAAKKVTGVLADTFANAGLRNAFRAAGLVCLLSCCAIVVKGTHARELVIVSILFFLAYSGFVWSAVLAGDERAAIINLGNRVLLRLAMGTQARAA